MIEKPRATPEKQSEYLQNQDPILRDIIQKVELPILNECREINFQEIVRVIIGQQLSGAAANKIYSKILTTYNNFKLTPKNALSRGEESFQSCGVSKPKSRSILKCAEFLTVNPSFLEDLKHETSTNIIIKLQTLHGIGIWSASILCMFHYGKEDVFPQGDATINKVMGKLYGDGKPLGQEKQMKIVRRWSPYKTFACKILWSWHDQGMLK